MKEAKTCSNGALSSINGAARLINEASPTPTSLEQPQHKQKDGIKWDSDVALVSIEIMNLI